MTAQIIKLSTVRTRRIKKQAVKELAVLAAVDRPIHPAERKIAGLLGEMIMARENWTGGQVTFARDLFGKLHAIFEAAEGG
jgi:hypothetical protein